MRESCSDVLRGRVAVGSGALRQIPRESSCQKRGDAHAVDMSGRISHQDLSEDLRSQISTGTLKPGKLLATEIGLTKTTGLSRGSVRLAISALVDAGMVERRAGKGIYVKQLRNERVIELVLPGLDSIWKDIAEGVQEVARNSGCKVQIFNARSDFESDMDFLRRLPTMGVDGAIIGSFHQRKMTTEILNLHLSGLPIVLLDQQMMEINVPSVGVDNYEAGYLAGSKLLKAGHQRVAFIGFEGLTGRLEGFRDAVNDHGVAFDRTNVVLNPRNWLLEGEEKQDLREQLQKLLAKPAPVTAFVFHNPGLAMLGLRGLLALGCRVPDDVSAVSIGDEPDWDWSDMGLSAVDLSAMEIGRVAAVKLLNRLDNAAADPDHSTVPVTWKSRESIKEIFSPTSQP